MIDAYLDILDYDNAGLTQSHFQKVFDSLSHKDQIDHMLFTHLTEKSQKLLTSSDQATLKPYHALYYFIVKGYLTTADILKEMAA